MAMSVLLESLRLLLLVKTATFSISDTSIVQDLNAQQACCKAQDLCRTITGALEWLAGEAEVDSSSFSNSCASDKVSVYLLSQVWHLTSSFFFVLIWGDGFAKSTAESAADATTWTVKNRVRSILVRTADGSMLPKDLAKLPEVDPIRAWQCIEDSTLVQLYHSLLASLWVRSFGQIVFRSLKIVSCSSWLYGLWWWMCEA